MRNRLRNKVFVTSATALVVSCTYKVLALAGVVPSVDENAVLEVASSLIDLLALLGVFVNPTTPGIKD